LKAKYKNIKYNLKEKSEGRFEKKLVKIFYAKIVRIEYDNDNKYLFVHGLDTRETNGKGD